MAISMIATKGCRYGSRELQPGDEFTVTGESEARLYQALQWAERRPALTSAPVYQPKVYQTKVMTPEPPAPEPPVPPPVPQWAETQPDQLEAQATEPESTESQVTEPQVTEPQVTEPVRVKRAYRRRDLTAERPDAE